MSNSPASPVVQRIQQSTLLFIVLIFALGALILAATNIDPNSAVRGNIKYTFWTSPDGAVSLEYPSDWTPVASNTANTFQYSFVVNPKDAQSQQGGYVVLSTQNVPANQKVETTIAGILVNLTNTQHPDAPLQPQNALVGGLKGVASTWSVTQNDPSGANPPVTIYQTLWMAPLDNTHFVFSSVQTLDPEVDFTKWEHTISTLHINKDAALKALGVTATPMPTSAATTSGTAAATAGATAQGTANVVPAATQQATPAATP